MLSAIESAGDRTDSQPDILDFFHENGYVGPFTLNDASLTRKVKSSWDFANVLRISSKFHNTTRDLHLYSSILYDIARSSELIDKVNLMLGSDLLLWTDHVLSRPPGNPGQAWHVDQTNYEVGGVHATISLTEMNRQNGCLKVIPGTHRYGISDYDLREFARQGRVDLEDEQSVATLADELFPENAPHPVVAVETMPNQYFFTKGGLWHGVSTNNSDKRRCAMVARYSTPDKEVKHAHTTPYKLPCVLVSGNNAGTANDIYQPPNSLFKNFMGLNYWINYLQKKLGS